MGQDHLLGKTKVELSSSGFEVRLSNFTALIEKSNNNIVNAPITVQNSYHKKKQPSGTISYINEEQLHSVEIIKCNQMGMDSSFIKQREETKLDDRSGLTGIQIEKKIDEPARSSDPHVLDSDKSDNFITS